MQRAVHRAQRPPDAPAQQRHLVFSGGPQRLAHRPVQLVADVLGEPHLGVLVIGDAPVDEEHVEAFREQELDERAALAQVEDLGPVDQREHEQDRDRLLAVAGAVAVQRRPAMRPDDLARRLADRGIGGRQDHVREVERGPRQVRQGLERAHGTFRARLGRAGAPFAPRRRRALVAELLQLLQDALQLVLGAMELAGEPRHIRPAGEPQVPQHEIRRVRADPGNRGDVLGHASQQHAEAGLGHELLEGARGVRLRLLVQCADLVLGARGAGGGHGISPPAPARLRPSARARPSPSGRGASSRRRARGLPRCRGGAAA